MPINAHGRIVWHDLSTPDPDAAQSFYTKITPWTTRLWEDVTPYTMWANEGAPLGGVMMHSEELKSRGVSPHWQAYVCFYDVDECVRHVGSLGGQVRMGPKEVPSVGCWAVISDPQGAVIGVFEATGAPPGRDGQPHRGEYSWHELTTSAYKPASEFYRALFKWDVVSEVDMGEMGMYHMFGQKGLTYGGMFNRRPDMPPPNWLSYIRVDNVKATAEKAAQLGGTVFNGPMEVPGGDWIAQLLDPQGVAVAVHGK